jgi:enoyl-CoA hydratase
MIELEVADNVARVTLCHPPVNALSRPWGERFFAILDELESRGDWQVLLLRSDQKVFSAGGDIKQYAGRLDDDDAGDLLADEARYYQQLFDRIAALPQVSIALIEGVAAGGGLELAMACDLRIAGETTKLGLMEVGVGLLPAGGGTQRMTQLVGRGMALKLIGLAELVQGRDALTLGLVEWAIPLPEIKLETEKIISRFLQQPPEALRAAKACIRAALDPSRYGFEYELTFPPLLMRTRATKLKINQFLSKQK